jgi:RNA polymerase sigma-B factor
MYLRRTVDQLQQTLGRSPTIAELAQRLQWAEEEVLEALAVAQSRQELSLDRPVGDDTEVSMGDRLAAPAAREETEDLLLLPVLVAGLPDLERQVVVLRFFHDLDQDAIAARIGYSQMQVSRLLRRALARLRADLVDC